jgi:hypothetical protein
MGNSFGGAAVDSGQPVSQPECKGECGIQLLRACEAESVEGYVAEGRQRSPC